MGSWAVANWAACSATRRGSWGTGPRCSVRRPVHRRARWRTASMLGGSNHRRTWAISPTESRSSPTNSKTYRLRPCGSALTMGCRSGPARMPCTPYRVESGRKPHLQRHGVPVSPFAVLRADEPPPPAPNLSFPCLLKTARFGYDGKGQVHVASPDELPRARNWGTGCGARECGRLYSRTLRCHGPFSLG